jgi:hypothetical protein
VNAVVGDYVVMTVGCQSAGVIGVKLKYLPPVVDWSNWNRQFDLVCTRAGGESTLMMPVYQDGSAYVFDGLVMRAADAGAVRSVATLRADPGVRLWLDLLIPEDWRTRSWFEHLKTPPVMPI